MQENHVALMADYSPWIDDIRRYRDQGGSLLRHRRLLACMGSRMALTLLIGALPSEQKLVGAVTTEREALAKLQNRDVDVLICTDRLEEGHGGSLIQTAKQQLSGLHTLMVVTEPGRPLAIRTALKAGCSGMCLESNLGHGTFVRALDVVSAGAAYIEQVLQDHYSKSYPGLGDAPIEQLSEREREVLQLVAAGHANQEIAARLFISPETVKSHLSRIRGKLQARDRVHAAVRGIWLGLVDWPEPG